MDDLPLIFPVSDYVTEEMEARGWTVADLAVHMGAPLSQAQAVVDGKHITHMAEMLGRAFGTSTQLWDNLVASELDYELHREWRKQHAARPDAAKPLAGRGEGE